MKEIPKMYMLYFFGNSLSYLLMDSLRGSVIDKNHVMASKTYANFVLIAVLTVVSVIADRVWTRLYTVGNILPDNINNHPSGYTRLTPPRAEFFLKLIII